jgi:hypothetical protein
MNASVRPNLATAFETPTADPVERYVCDHDQIIVVLGADGTLQHRFLYGPQIDQPLADGGRDHCLRR